jgi:capsular exopolysaccharide synthesis family protein
VEQASQVANQLIQCELELVELNAKLQAKLAEDELQKSSSGEQAITSNEKNDGLLDQKVIFTFKADPDVAPVIDQIRETEDELKHNIGIAKKGHDPSRVAAQRQLQALHQQYKKLWNEKRDLIRQRLLVETSAVIPEDRESVAELRKLIATEETKKASIQTLLSKFSLDKTASQEDALEANQLRKKLESLSVMEHQAYQKLQSLEFVKDKSTVNIPRKDLAVLPKVASNNKRVKFLALLFLGSLGGVIGLFLLLEVLAERVADPDSLSSRVQSEVFSLPPLPTVRSQRKLNHHGVDDQLDRFIQRLDHLRFAVCGNHQNTELGRCVLITSAIGGEGKTTLAAQLAARCGNAGISTVLIDADLRRASLCPLLDVPEGLGLSDLLEDDATVKLEEVLVPVQNGAFFLLTAGSPVQDASRVLQSRHLPELIAQLRQSYDMIIIDSPPVLPVPDSLVLGRWSDGALLAARFEVSRSPQVERARRQLDNAGVPVLGTVINGMRSSDSYYGRYTYNRQRTMGAADPGAAETES